jgi:hypothetical protein
MLSLAMIGLFPLTYAYQGLQGVGKRETPLLNKVRLSRSLFHLVRGQGRLFLMLTVYSDQKIG